jgi:hypothetical protein
MLSHRAENAALRTRTASESQPREQCRAKRGDQ